MRREDAKRTGQRIKQNDDAAARWIAAVDITDIIWSSAVKSYVRAKLFGIVRRVMSCMQYRDTKLDEDCDRWALEV